MTRLIAADAAGSLDPLRRGIAVLAAGAVSGRTAAPRQLLDDPSTLWIVTRGAVDVFAVEIDAARIGPRRFLWSVEAPAALLGLPPSREGGGAMVAVAGAGAAISGVPFTALRALAAQSATEAAAIVEAWVTDVAAAMARDRAAPDGRPLRADERVVLSSGERAAPRHGVVWASVRRGRVRFGDVSAVAPHDGPIPLAPGASVTADVDGAEVALVDTAAAIAAGTLWQGLTRFGALVSDWVAARTIAARRAERERLTRKAAADRRMRDDALESLAALLDARPEPRAAPDGGDPLLAACRLVGSAARIEFRLPPAWQIERRLRDPLAAICRASRVRSRLVALPDRWWRDEHGPLLGFDAASGAPMALLPRARGGYDRVDPSGGTRLVVDERVAASLRGVGCEFYRPLPERRLGVRDLAAFLFADARADMFRLIAAALASGLLGLALPVATGTIFSEIIPMAVPAYILPIVAALAGVAIGAAAFDLMRALAIVRIQGVMSGRLQAAVVDRLLSLPVPFFRAYSVGDLAMRAGAINAIRDVLAGAVLATVLTGIFSAANLALLFYYSPRLALVAVAVIAATLAFEAATAVAAVRIQRRTQAAGGRVAGLLFDMIQGVAKLRVAGAEPRAFAVWAARFRAHRQEAFRAGVLQNVVTVFNGVLPVAAALALFAAAGPAAIRGTGVGTGTFIAFNTAFGAFFATAVALGNTAIDVLGILPLVERAAPILHAAVESGTLRPDPGELSGRIEVSHVSFRYAADGPAVLDDVSIEAHPGEYVALVGSSGSGKSTLLRLVLGLDAPEAGAIYYDGQDLAAVDLAGVRAQLGVVLQSSRILGGDLLGNIIGSSPLTAEDAWAAAEMAGLAADIRAMPMGMQTVIPEGGTTLSGGQRQRLLIARALVRRPRIVLFDEATSALDNRTQEIVTRSLERLNATRLVIAHRLSTIRRADRIYVLERGRVVEQGSYDALAAADGAFARLIARQMA